MSEGIQRKMCLKDSLRTRCEGKIKVTKKRNGMTNESDSVIGSSKRPHAWMLSTALFLQVTSLSVLERQRIRKRNTLIQNVWLGKSTRQKFHFGKVCAVAKVRIVAGNVQ